MYNGHQYKIAFIATVYRHLEAFHTPFKSLLQQKGYEIHAYARPDAGKLSLEKQNIICHDIPFRRSTFHFQNLMALKQLIERFMARWTDYLITINQEDFKECTKFPG